MGSRSSTPFRNSGVRHRCIVRFGFCPLDLAWFVSDLQDRKQYGVDSKTENTEFVVPQDSCLGPPFFLYINDIPKAVHNFTTSMYADDTRLCYKSNDLSRLNGAINEDLSRLDS